MPKEMLFEESLKQSSGFLSNRERGVAVPMNQSTALQDLIYNGIVEGRRVPSHAREFMIKEAMTTSDFPYLFGDVLDRQVLAMYQATDPVWKKFCKLSTVNRIWPNIGGYRFRMSGGDEHLAEVGQKGEYLASTRAEARYILYVKKYGRQYDISWEAMINDDLGALKDTPKRFARAAARTEHRIATALYYHNVVLATAGRGNLTANPLTIANLETALEWFAAQTDVGGEPIANRARYLVVPPALELTARQILTSSSKMWLTGATDFAALPSVSYPTTNVVANYGLELVIDPYITVLGVAGGTPLSAVGSWYLFSDPNELAAIECAHLSGHENPEIVMKASDKVSIGGGAMNPMSGDFATDNVFYRVRDVFGGITEDWRAFYFGGHLD
ncbi:hypothetical protein KKF61_07160 [Patescibacteria group bacterium]|nr:hypothetical protein [Patescibacteria group bacterium]